MTLSTVTLRAGPVSSPSRRAALLSSLYFEADPVRCRHWSLPAAQTSIGFATRAVGTEVVEGDDRAVHTSPELYALRLVRKNHFPSVMLESELPLVYRCTGSLLQDQED